MQWEYKDKYVSQDRQWNVKEAVMPVIDLDELNTLGMDGWELVAVVGHRLLFKRPKYSPATGVTQRLDTCDHKWTMYHESGTHSQWWRVCGNCGVREDVPFNSVSLTYYP